MSEVNKLTKAAILQGKVLVVDFYVEELGGSIPLRPLTEGQFNKVETTKMGGIKVKGNPIKSKGRGSKREDMNVNMDGLEMEMDLEVIQEKEFEADCLAVAYAIADGEKWTTEDVKGIRPPKTVSKIAQEVYRISGATPQGVDDAKSFRGQ